MAKIKWQQSEIDYVVANYSKFQAADIAAHLNRSEKSIYHIASRYKLSSRPNWSDDEIEYLKNNVRKVSYEQISSYLNRSLSSCYNKAYELKLTLPEDRSYMNVSPISEVENNYVMSHYMTKTDSEIASDLNISESKVVRIRRLNHIVKVGGKMLGKMTKPERLMSNILSDANVLFDFEPILFKQRPDFYLPNHRIVIEVNGDYWHGNPCLYETYDDIQQRHINRDIEKYDIYHQLGFLTLIVWEKDINSNLEIVKNKILEYLNSAVFGSNAIDYNWAKSVNSFEWFRENTEENQIHNSI